MSNRAPISPIYTMVCSRRISTGELTFDSLHTASPVGQRKRYNLANLNPITGKHTVDYKKFNDEILLRLIVHGNEQALSELYDRYNRLVFSIALNALGDALVAEEIIQDVFLRVWERAATFQPEQGKVITWLGRIARNRSIDLYRQRSIRPEGNSVSWDGLPNLHLTDEQDIEASVDLANQQQRVRRAMAHIPAEQRQALVMAFFQGLSHQEIATALNEPLGTVKTRIRLGMHKLKTMLEER